MSFDDFGPTPMTHNVAVGPGSQHMQAGYNEGITPVFMTHLEADPVATEREGRPMFRETTIAILHIAGDPYNKVPIELSQAKERFPVHYEKWLAKHEEKHISGTPLRAWPLLSVHEVAEMEALNIFNVESLAQIADTNITRMPSLRTYREKAKAFLEHAADSAAIGKYAAENERMRDEVAELTAQVKELSKQYKDLEADHRRSKKA